MRKSALLAGLASLVMIAQLPAQVICSFSGSGTSGTDCLGQSWMLVNLDPSGSTWGIPGLGFGSIPYLGSVAATDFHITFNASGSFDGLIGPADAANFFTTRFDNEKDLNSGDGFWTVTVNGNEADFFAPAGDPLKPGDRFFVNVAFLNGYPTDPADFSFTASWTDSGAATTPEPATLSLLATGLVGMAGAAVRRKRRA